MGVFPLDKMIDINFFLIRRTRSEEGWCDVSEVSPVHSENRSRPGSVEMKCLILGIDKLKQRVFVKREN